MFKSVYGAVLKNLIVIALVTSRLTQLAIVSIEDADMSANACFCLSLWKLWVTKEITRRFLLQRSLCKWSHKVTARNHWGRFVPTKTDYHSNSVNLDQHHFFSIFIFLFHHKQFEINERKKKKEKLKKKLNANKNIFQCLVRTFNLFMYLIIGLKSRLNILI